MTKIMETKKEGRYWRMYGRADRSVYDGWVLIASGTDGYLLRRARHFWDLCYDEIKVEFSDSEEVPQDAIQRV